MALILNCYNNPCRYIHQSRLTEATNGISECKILQIAMGQTKSSLFHTILHFNVDLLVVKLTPFLYTLLLYSISQVDHQSVC